MRLSISVAIFLILSSFTVTSEASDLYGNILYRGKPLGNADITLKSNNRIAIKSKSNRFGYYSLRKLSPGRYVLIISLPDRSTRSEEVYVFPQNTEKNLNID